MLEKVPADCAIHRLTGTASTDILLAPGWCNKKWQVINAIYAEMQHRGSTQGCRSENSISGIQENRLQQQLPSGLSRAGSAQVENAANLLVHLAV
jgi:hypothetical protein